MGQDNSKHQAEPLSDEASLVLSNQFKLDKTAIGLLYQKYQFVTRGAPTIPKKEFYRFFSKRLKDAHIDAMWNVFLHHRWVEDPLALEVALALKSGSVALFVCIPRQISGGI
jgi:hypothetical protein